MTAIVSNATGGGNWNAGASWAGGTAPGNGDTATIANGDTITIPNGVTITVGTSPANDAGTPAIQTNTVTGTGILVIASGGNLTYRGSIRMGAANWTIGAGCTIKHDSSLAGVPATANYTWAPIGTGRLIINGVQGNRTTFSIAASSGNAGGFLTSAPNTDCGQMSATYASFSDYGTAAGLYFNRFNLNTTGTKFTLDNCLLDRCGKASANDVRLGCDFRVKQTSMRSPVSSDGISLETDAGGNGLRVGTVTGDWRIDTAYIDGQVFLFNSAFNSTTVGMNIVGSVWAGTTAVAPYAGAGGCGFQFSNTNLWYNRVSGAGGFSESPSGTLTNMILLRTNGGVTNPHVIGSMRGTMSWDGFIVENDSDAAANDGDIFQSITAGSAFTISIKHGVVIPTPGGLGIGSFFNHSTPTAANGTTIFAPVVTVEHNTYVGGDQGNDTEGVGGENNTAFLGMIASVQSNLIWGATSRVGWLTKYQLLVTPVNGTYTTCNFNGYFNITGIRYGRNDTNPGFYTNPPGGNDINANPNFVDSTRNFLKWAQSVDATVVTWTDALNRFSKMNDDSGSVPGFTPAAMYTWVRAGFAPTNATFKGAGADGQDIGAINVQASSSTSSLSRRSRTRNRSR